MKCDLECFLTKSHVAEKRIREDKDNPVEISQTEGITKDFTEK